MADMHVKTGAATWKSAVGLHVKTAASTWKEVTNAYIKTGASTWKKFYSALTVTLSGETVSDNDPVNSRTVTATITVDSNGNMYKTENVTTTQIDAVTDWVRPTTEAPNYYVRFTKSGLGSTPTVGAALEGVWSPTTVDREYGYQHSNNNTTLSDFNLTVEIATDLAGTNIVASGTYNLSAARGT